MHGKRWAALSYHAMVILVALLWEIDRIMYDR